MPLIRNARTECGMLLNILSFSFNLRNHRREATDYDNYGSNWAQSDYDSTTETPDDYSDYQSTTEQTKIGEETNKTLNGLIRMVNIGDISEASDSDSDEANDNGGSIRSKFSNGTRFAG